MRVHMRVLGQNVMLCRATQTQADPLFASSNIHKVTCADCLRRYGNGGDKMGVATDPPKVSPQPAAMALAS